MLLTPWPNVLHSASFLDGNNGKCGGRKLYLVILGKSFCLGFDFLSFKIWSLDFFLNFMKFYEILSNIGKIQKITVDITQI